MGAYLRLLGSLVQNLARRVGEDLADCAVVCRRGVVYQLRNFRLRYDDVGPATVPGPGPDWQPQPQQLAALVESVKGKPWFCELDRKSAQDLVHDGGPGCFLVRPSGSTKSLTLTVWHRHRAYNILVRQREDGLLALGSWKNQEMTFRSVEEMVWYYEREPLILYSGGELTGTTRLKAPPPGLVRNLTTKTSEPRRNNSVADSRRTSEIRRSSDSAALRALSFGSLEVPFNSLKIPEASKVFCNSTGLRTVSFGTSEMSQMFPSLLEERNELHKTAVLPTVSFGNAEVPLNPHRLREGVNTASAAKDLKSFSSKDLVSQIVVSTEKVQALQTRPGGHMKVSTTSNSDVLKESLKSYYPGGETFPFVSKSHKISPEIVQYPKDKTKNSSELPENSPNYSKQEPLSPRNFSPPFSYQIDKKFAISTPNIDIANKSGIQVFPRRRSCDNLVLISPLPSSSPRSPSSFKETQRNLIKPFVKTDSSSLINGSVHNQKVSSIPAPVHGNVSTLSFFKTGSIPSDCSC